MARRDALERGGDPRAVGSGGDPWTCQPTPPMVSAATSRRPLMACLSPRSTLRMETLSQVPNSTKARLKRLTGHAAEFYATGAPVVLAGDFNVVPTGIDIYPTKSWDRDVLLQPQSRAACSPGKRGTQLCRDHTEPVAQSRLT
jgi:hypothetical protein